MDVSKLSQNMDSHNIITETAFIKSILYARNFKMISNGFLINRNFYLYPNKHLISLTIFYILFLRSQTLKKSICVC